MRRVLHWGPSEDIKLYNNVAESMREYISNKEECRRKLLLKDFDGSEEHTADLDVTLPLIRRVACETQ